MRYRKLDENGDYVFGIGQGAFYRDNPEAVAQAVKTRLALFKGEWFLDNEEGMDWNTQVLGVRTGETRDLAIRSHILDTEGVNQILEYGSGLNPDTRVFSVVVRLNTIYGETTVISDLGDI